MDGQRPCKRGFHFLADVGVRAQQARIVRGDIDCPNYGTARFNAMRTGTRGRQDLVERVAQAAPFSADRPGAQPEEVVSVECHRHRLVRNKHTISYIYTFHSEERISRLNPIRPASSATLSGSNSESGDEGNWDAIRAVAPLRCSCRPLSRRPAESDLFSTA